MTTADDDTLDRALAPLPRSWIDVIAATPVDVSTRPAMPYCARRTAASPGATRPVRLYATLRRAAGAAKRGAAPAGLVGEGARP